MSLFFRREKEVRALIHEYFETTDKAIEEFEAGVRCYLETGPCDEFRETDKRIHVAESRADDLLRQIEIMLYSSSLLPESRGDLLGLLENFDKMPNLAEIISFILDTQQVQLPDAYRPRLLQLLEINVEAYRLVRETVDKLFSIPEDVGEAVGPVDAKESESDRLEGQLIREVFASDMDGCEKIQLRELIQRLGDLSDSAENVAGRLEIISLKKRI
jgi:predicted phosphate transport protein (TIGR00153 family)